MTITRTKLTGLIFLLLFFLVNHSSFAQEEMDGIENAGSLSGRVVFEDGSPLTAGFVAFFSNEDGTHQDYGNSKRSPVMVSFVKEDGKFTTQLFPAGSYFIGAMPRQRWVGGPPKAGEKRYSAFDDQGKYLTFSVKGGQTIDIGTIMVKEPTEFPDFKEYFTVSGKILDDKGQGIAGSVVVVKRDLDDPKGLFISAETADDGSYQLKIPPGKYFFVARKTLTRAGRPKPGSLMGTLGHNEPIGIGGKSKELPAYVIGKNEGEYSGVNITMFKVPIPDVKRKEVEAKVKAKKIDKHSLPEDLPLRKKPTLGTVESPHETE